MTVNSNLSIGLGSLVIFRNLLQAEPIIALQKLLDTDLSDTETAVNRYCAFASALFAKEDNFSHWLLSFINEDENLYIEHILQKTERPALDRILSQELEFLTQLAHFDGASLRAQIDYSPLPTWETSDLDLKAKYQKRIEEIPTRGFGIYAKYHVFTMSDDGKLIPVKHPDKQSLSDLYGYETERKKVIVNTQALLNGTPANNVLLYGDAGTGKSSTVKALVNHFKGDGLRLIEIGKKQLYKLPELMDHLAANPLKFIIFIDDLCFESDDKDFSAFKAILEGSVSNRGQNILIYATSNHRHMVKERNGDRTGDELHVADAIQELSSLSERFGLTVTFMRPDKTTFLEIVLKLAEKANIQLPQDVICQKAETYAIRSGGRNARCAKQFIELLQSGIV